MVKARDARDEYLRFAFVGKVAAKNKVQFLGTEVRQQAAQLFACRQVECWSAELQVQRSTRHGPVAQLVRAHA